MAATYRKAFNVDLDTYSKIKNKKIKPIFITQFPKGSTPAFVAEMNERLKNSLLAKDYHILTFIGTTPEYKFECFNPADTTVDLEGLKKIIQQNSAGESHRKETKLIERI